jgi:geranylgeranyl pyrophosphate synthase
MLSQTQALDLGRLILKRSENLKFEYQFNLFHSLLPQEVQTLLDHPGKRIRPALVYLSATAYNLPLEQVDIFAKAIEMTHVASLVHDDVIDEAHERRKKITWNAQYQNNLAVLGGDFLLSQVISDLASKGHTEHLIQLTRAIQLLADGEWLQYQVKINFKATQSDLKQIAIKKTGALMSGAFCAPAKLKGISEGELQKWQKLGEDLGHFFQILDDINDFNPKSGKPYANDLLGGQLNAVTQWILENHPETQSVLKNFELERLPDIKPFLEPALEVIRQRSLSIQEQLLLGFEQIEGLKDAEILKLVFEKMLNKIRESFTPS